MFSYKRVYVYLKRLYSFNVMYYYTKLYNLEENSNKRVQLI